MKPCWNLCIHILERLYLYSFKWCAVYPYQDKKDFQRISKRFWGIRIVFARSITTSLLICVFVCPSGISRKALKMSPLSDMFVSIDVSSIGFSCNTRWKRFTGDGEPSLLSLSQSKCESPWQDWLQHPHTIRSFNFTQWATLFFLSVSSSQLITVKLRLL